MDVDEDTPAKGKAPAATEDSADAMATDGAAEGAGSRAGAASWRHRPGRLERDQNAFSPFHDNLHARAVAGAGWLWLECIMLKLFCVFFEQLKTTKTSNM